MIDQMTRQAQTRSFPDRLREARRMAQLTEFYCAMETGIRPEDYQEVEDGMKRPTLRQRVAIERFIRDIGGESLWAV